MLFTCLPEGARIPDAFRAPHARGKWFTIDIHCHVTSLRRRRWSRATRPFALVPGNTGQRAQSEINRQNGVRTRVRGRRRSNASPTWTDGDRHPGDFAGAAADLLWRRSGARWAAARTLNDEIADIVGRFPSASPALARSAAAPCDRQTGTVAQFTRHARHRDHDPCRRRKPVGRAVPQDIRADRRTRVADILHPDAFTEARRFKDHYFANVIGDPLDTTVALHHLIFGGVLEDCPA